MRLDDLPGETRDAVIALKKAIERRHGPWADYRWKTTYDGCAIVTIDKNHMKELIDLRQI